MQKQPNYHFERGSAALETSIVLIALILLGMLVLELTHSQKIRQLAQLALFESARTGSVTSAEPLSMDFKFRQAILPLFSPAQAHTDPKQRLANKELAVMKKTGLSLWEINILNPVRASFADFADTGLSQKNGRLTLKNDYLAQQHQEKIRQGWIAGRGSFSKQTIFEANTLKLELSFLYKPLTPGIGFILRLMHASQKNRTAQAWRHGYLVAYITTEVMMQSHAQQWVADQENKKYASGPVNNKPKTPHARIVKHEARRPEKFSVPIHSADTQTHPPTLNDPETQNEENACNGLICCP